MIYTLLATQVGMWVWMYFTMKRQDLLQKQIDEIKKEKEK